MRAGFANVCFLTGRFKQFENELVQRRAFVEDIFEGKLFADLTQGEGQPAVGTEAGHEFAPIEIFFFICQVFETHMVVAAHANQFLQERPHRRVGPHEAENETGQLTTHEDFSDPGPEQMFAIFLQGNFAEQSNLRRDFADGRSEERRVGKECRL